MRMRPSLTTRHLLTVGRQHPPPLPQEAAFLPLPRGVPLFAPPSAPERRVTPSKARGGGGRRHDRFHRRPARPRGGGVT